LTIVLTKCDLIDKLDERIISPFLGIISTIETSDFISGCLIPITCGSQMINVQMPLFFSLKAVLNIYAPEVQNTANQFHEQVAVLQANTKGVWGLLDGLEKSMNGEKTSKKMAEEILQKAIDKDNEYQVIKQAIKTLDRYLEKLPLVEKGMTLDKYLEKLSGLKVSMAFNHTQKNCSLFPIYSDPFDAFNH
jgi:hypothetical protein